MNDPSPIKIDGLFDRTTKGLVMNPVAVLLERGRIQFFSEVLGITDPLHTDVEAARSAGHPDIMAPPSFYMAIEASANATLARKGQRSAMAIVGCDFRYLLHGDETYAYRAPLYAGDEVTFTTKVVDFYDKKGGAMEFVMLESTVEHAARGLLMRATRNLLHRLA